MMSADYVLQTMYLLIIAISCLHVYCANGEPRLEATTPVNPVEEGGIFALHCQVKNLRPGDEVTILRKVTGDVTSTRISMQETLMDVDERVYLAVRQLGDGSGTVYFLTIMEVKKEDEGDYTCKITNTDSNGNLASGLVSFRTKYFPPDSDPLCDTVDVSNVDIGQRIVLTCSSELGNPEIDLEWIQTGSEIPLESVKSFQHNRLISTLTVDISSEHNGAIFSCKIQSDGFPSDSSTCHVGPVMLFSNPTGGFNPVQDTNTQLSDRTLLTLPPSDNSKSGFVPQECRTLCKTNSSKITYWTIGTIIAGVLAIFLCIWVVILFVKYRHLPSQRKSGYIAGRQLPEGIYSEPETYRCNNTMNTMYITLDKQKKQAAEQEMHRETPTYLLQHVRKPDS